MEGGQAYGAVLLRSMVPPKVQSMLPPMAVLPKVQSMVLPLPHPASHPGPPMPPGPPGVVVPPAPAAAPAPAAPQKPGTGAGQTTMQTPQMQAALVAHQGAPPPNATAHQQNWGAEFGTEG